MAARRPIFQESEAVKQVILVGLTLTLSGATTVASSSGRVVDIPERAQGARTVVVATAVRVTPTWHRNAFGDELIVSRVALQVEETLKGTPGRLVTLELEGGTLDGLTLKVSSLPTVHAGERAVFFLDAGANGAHRPHLKGLGILKLDANNLVRGSSLHLDDVRRMTKGAGR
jgi:hypothetical protein